MSATIIAIASACSLLLGPLAAGIAGWMRHRTEARPSSAPAIAGHPVIVSTLACTLAFNLTFFIQELFLVLPKALTPGLEPTLFHNNHAWTGSHPLAELFQGTGAAATLLSATLCAALLARGAGRTLASRLFLLWMTYCGFMMALPQLVVGALSGASDLGRALGYLQVHSAARLALALLALAAMPWIAWRLARGFLALSASMPGSAGLRSGWLLRVVTLPALLSVALIVPFRVPREVIEVIVVPFAVMVAGVPWMQASAAWHTAVVSRPARDGGLAVVLVATLVLLALFQGVLRRGIAF